jgi:hypothetical protein
VAEPETKGVIKRLFRTRKEKIIHGRVFQTIGEVRRAVRDFAARYNAEWLVEKDGYLSPLDAPTKRMDARRPRAVSSSPVSRDKGAVQAIDCRGRSRFDGYCH